VTDVLVFLAASVAVAAVVCGHQGQSWPLAGLWRAARGAVAASRAVWALGEHREAPDASGGLLSAPGSAAVPLGGPSGVTSCRQSAPQASSAPFPAPTAERASEALLCPPAAPSWARTDKEAA
jgi:hypothetical protein